jgi:hypothetical protein
MTKGLISIFALPQEIDNLYTTLYNLKRNASVLPKDCQFGFDITLCLSDELTRWDNSLPKQYFEDKFNETIEKLCDWAIPESIKIETGTDILGCVSQRRHSLKYLDKYDFTLWLDNDLFFNDYFLSYIHLSTTQLKQSNTDYYVITPQITRQWDTTWDVLVNKELLSRDLNDNLVADVFKLSLTPNEGVLLTPIDKFKGAGGWGTVISNPLLKLIGIPESLGHYGLEDTYVLQCADMLGKIGKHARPQQFVLENVLVCENHKYGTNNYLNKHVDSIYRREEYLKIARDNFKKELHLFLERVKQ